jgi:hypothetical protein
MACAFLFNAFFISSAQESGRYYRLLVARDRRALNVSASPSSHLGAGAGVLNGQSIPLVIIGEIDPTQRKRR